MKMKRLVLLVSAFVLLATLNVGAQQKKFPERNSK